jgi:predicted nucleotidyltransferase
MAAPYARIVSALSTYQPERIYLFGSQARGEAGSLSDINLILVKRTTLPLLERLQEVRRFLPAGLGHLDLLVYTPDELAEMQQRGNAFSELIVAEAQLICGRQTQKRTGADDGRASRFYVA